MVMITMDLRSSSSLTRVSSLKSAATGAVLHRINYANSYNSLTYKQHLARGIPWKSSGAAYGGLPQKVFSLLPIVNSLLKPKSASLMFLLWSISRFSACNILTAIIVRQQLHRYDLRCVPCVVYPHFVITIISLFCTSRCNVLFAVTETNCTKSRRYR